MCTCTCVHTHRETEYVFIYTHIYIYQIETVAWRTDDRKTLGKVWKANFLVLSHTMVVGGQPAVDECL